MSHRRGLTLAEVIVGLVLGMFLLAFGFRLLSHGLRSSIKGAAQLTIMQGGMLVSSSIERDLLRAQKVQVQGNRLQLAVLVDIAAGQPVLSQVSFEIGPDSNGFRRQESRSGQAPLDHILARDMKFSQLDQEPVFQQVALDHGGYGVRIRFRVTTSGPEPAVGKRDSLDLDRFLVSSNAPENHPFPEFQGPP